MTEFKQTQHSVKEEEIAAAFGGGAVPPFNARLAMGAPDFELRPCWFIGAGVALVILGLLAASFPFFFSMAGSIFLGVFLLLGGVAELVQGFAHSGFGGAALKRALRWELILMGACLSIAGLFMIFAPAAGSVFVTSFVGALFVFGGVGRLFWAARHRHALGWGGIVFSAIVTLALGVLIFATLPYSGVTFIGIYIAVELLMLGFSALTFGFALRQWQKNNAA